MATNYLEYMEELKRKYPGYNPTGAQQSAPQKTAVASPSQPLKTEEIIFGRILTDPKPAQTAKPLAKPQMFPLGLKPAQLKRAEAQQPQSALVSNARSMLEKKRSEALQAPPARQTLHEYNQGQQQSKPKTSIADLLLPERYRRILQDTPILTPQEQYAKNEARLKEISNAYGQAVREGFIEQPKETLGSAITSGFAKLKDTIASGNDTPWWAANAPEGAIKKVGLAGGGGDAARLEREKLERSIRENPYYSVQMAREAEALRKKQVTLQSQMAQEADKAILEGRKPGETALKNAGYGLGRTGLGLLGAIEGVADFIPQVAGAPAQWLGMATGSEGIKNVGDYIASSGLKNDVTGTLRGKLDEAINPTSKEQEAGAFVESLAAMLPMMAIGARAGANPGQANVAANAAKQQALLGAAANETAGSALAQAGLLASLSGKASQEAYNQTGDIMRSTAHGIASGLMELGTERISGGIPGLGGGAFGSGKIANILGEGVEEGISAIAEPWIERGTGVNPAAQDATLKDVGTQALLGALGAGIYNAPFEVTNAIDRKRFSVYDAVMSPKNRELSPQELLDTPTEQLSKYQLKQRGELIANSLRQMMEAQTFEQPAQPVQAPQAAQITNQGATTIPADVSQNPAQNPQAAQDRAAAVLETQLLTSKLKESSPALSKMQPVSVLSGNEFAKGQMNLVEQVSSFFKRLGNMVTRPDFGDVVINERGIKDSMSHGVGRLKAVTFAAIPDVIKNGVQIDYQQNWKGRGYDTYVFAAPVTVNGEKRNVGAVVMQLDGTNRYYLHEVVDSDGNIIFTQKDGAPRSRPGAATSAVLPGGEQPFNDIIPSSAQNVNTQSTESQQDGARMGEGDNRSEFIEHVRRSINMSDEQKAQFKQAVEDGLGLYYVLTDKDALDKAEKIMNETSAERVRGMWDAAMETGSRPNKRAIGLAFKLLEQYRATGDTQNMIEMIADLTEQSVMAGQGLQAFKLLDKITMPAGRLVYLNRVMENFARQHEKTLKGAQLQIPPELQERMMNAQSTEEMDAVQGAIEQAIADQIPATLREKLNAWRYTAMLLNPKTHIRNITGNALMGGLRQTKDVIGAGLEAIVLRGERKGERTKSIINPLSKQDRANLAYARQAWDASQQPTNAGGRFDENTRRGIDERRRIFNNKAGEFLRRLSTRTLAAEDTLFSRGAFIDAYAKEMKARGLTADTITPQQAAQISADANEEALRATFNDANRLAEDITRLQNRWGIAGDIVVGGILPFKRTPINVLKRAVDYSPAGFVEGAFMAVNGARTGKYTTAQALDRMASGLTGTGLMMLGMYLARIGILRGSGEEDDNYEYYLQDTGEQKYSLNIGDWSATINWAAPAVIPMFMGVELYSAVQGRGIDFGTLLDAFADSMMPVQEMSMLQGLNEAVRENDSLTQILAKALESYATQFIPSVSGQIASTIDPTRRLATGDPTAPLGKDIDAVLRRAQRKIPGLSKTLEPYIDKWGNDQTDNEAWPWRVAENMLSPAYVNPISTTKLDAELIRLYDSTGADEIIPYRPSRTFQADGKTITLSAEEYTDFQIAIGQATWKAASATVGSTDYKIASDKGKLAMLKKSMEKARETAREDFKRKHGYIK